MKSKVANTFDSTFFRYILIGLLNTGFGYAVFVLLIYLGSHYIFATLTSTTVGICFNYLTYGALVFNQLHLRHIPGFLATYAVVYFAFTILVTLISFLGFNYYVSGGLATPPTALLSYYLNRFFVYTHE